MPRPAQRSYLGLVSADAPDAATAQVHLLCTGASRGLLASTVGFIRDGDTKVIIDPGMVADREHILAPLAELGELAGSVTDVVFSHPDPSHTLHAALFPNARYHDHQAIYHRDQRLARRGDRFLISPAVRLIETTGPAATQLTTLAATEWARSRHTRAAEKGAAINRKATANEQHPILGPKCPGHRRRESDNGCRRCGNRSRQPDGRVRDDRGRFRATGRRADILVRA